jgi:hypothetical protein
VRHRPNIPRCLQVVFLYIRVTIETTMIRKLVLLLFVVTLFLSCKDNSSTIPDLGCKEEKSYVLLWEQNLGKDFTNIIPNENRIHLVGNVDGANKLLTLDCTFGDIESSFNSYGFNRNYLFKSDDWLVSTYQAFSCYNLSAGTSKVVNPAYSHGEYAGMINDHLHYGARRVMQASDPRDYDMYLTRYSMDFDDTVVLHFTNFSDFRSFTPHGFVVDRRDSDPQKLYYVYGKDLQNPHQLTLAKYEEASYTSTDLVNFESKGNVSDFSQKEFELFFLNYDKKTGITWNLNTDELNSKVEFPEPVELIERAPLCFASRDNKIALYDMRTGLLLWEIDNTDLNIRTNLSTDGNYIYAASHNALYVINKDDGCIISKLELSFIGDNTENWLNNVIYCYDDASIVLSNPKQAFALRVKRD